MNAEQLARVWDALMGLLENSQDFGCSEAAGNCLARLAPRLSSDQATRRADVLIGLLQKSTFEPDVRAAGNCLVVLAPKLSDLQIDRGRDALMSVLQKPEHENVTLAAAECLSALRPRLGGGQDASTQGNAIIRLILTSVDRNELRKSYEVLVALSPTMNADVIDQSVKVLIQIMQTSQDSSGKAAVTKCLSKLTRQMNVDQVNETWSAMIDEVSKTTDNIPYPGLGEAFAAMADKVSAEQRIRAAELLVQQFGRKMYVGEECPHTTVLKLLNGLPVESLMKSSAEQITNQNCIYSELPWFTMGLADFTMFESTSLRLCLSNISDARWIASLLSHPGCVGYPRKYFLLRFEELVFHNGQHLFLKAEKPKNEDATEESKIPEADAARLAQGAGAAVPERRFHNLHDAAAWIEQNWPDFDLEANHPMTWRAGN